MPSVSQYGSAVHVDACKLYLIWHIPDSNHGTSLVNGTLNCKRTIWYLLNSIGLINRFIMHYYLRKMKKIVYNTTMAEGKVKDKQEPNTGSQAPAEQELPIDTKLLSEAVIELNISRKNVGIYPPGHVQITRSIDRAYEILRRLFEIRPEMTLGVAKDTLLVGQDYLDQKNPVFRDFALTMHQQGIAAVTFIHGLDKDELVRFHRVLTTKPDEIRALGGIEKVMSNLSSPHIRILPIDFSSFHLTEEEEIFHSQIKAEGGEKTGGKGGSGNKTVAGVWQDFVSHLTEGKLAGSQGQGMSLKDAGQIDPAELARLLNERKLDANAAIESYDRIITTHIRGAAEKKQLTHEQSQTLESLNVLLKDLHPELRKQFLSIAVQRIASSAPSAAEEIVGGFTDDIVIEMIAQASSEGREISPTLAGLVGKLSKAQSQAQSGVTNGPQNTESKKVEESLHAPIILPEHMQKLFDREKYEDYVSKDYDAMLRQMSAGAAVARSHFPLEEHKKTLEDARLDFQIGRALLAFMEENIEEEDYKEFAQKLITIMPGFLETGNFELIWDISETLRRHTTEKPVKGIRTIAEESRKLFADSEFRLKVLKAFEKWMKDKGHEAAGLIQAMGSDTVPGLLDIYSRDASVGGRRLVFNLLRAFGDRTVSEAHKRLRDSRPYYVRNLLILIRRAGNQTSIPYVKQLVKHRDLKVRMEALSTLLHFKDPESVKLLRDTIHSKDPDVASQAVALAGQYHVHEVTEDVLSRLKRIILFESDYTVNEEIILVLGEIGDVRAIHDLEKLARASWSLYPKGLMRMKELLFESLGRYPKESIGNLLKIGERLDSDKIRMACRKLMERT
jgi:hypothetical protein